MVQRGGKSSSNKLPESEKYREAKKVIPSLIPLLDRFSNECESSSVQENYAHFGVLENEIESIMQCIQHNSYNLPLYQSMISAGFPSPAEIML